MSVMILRISSALLYKMENIRNIKENNYNLGRKKNMSTTDKKNI